MRLYPPPRAERPVRRRALGTVSTAILYRGRRYNPGDLVRGRVAERLARFAFADLSVTPTDPPKRREPTTPEPSGRPE